MSQEKYQGKGSARQSLIAELPRIVDPRGNLTVIEQLTHIPFKINNVLLGSTKGGACAASSTSDDVNTSSDTICGNGEVFIVALNGAMRVAVYNSDEAEDNSFMLDRLDRGLYVPEGVSWQITDMEPAKDEGHDMDMSVLILSAKEENVSGPVVDLSKRVGFTVKRVFYTYEVPAGEDRGAHAHKCCQQYIVAATGRFDVTLDDGATKTTVALSDHSMGVEIPPGMWASQQNFTPGSICLVLTSQVYDESDYIRQYKEFLELKDIVITKRGV